MKEIIALSSREIQRIQVLEQVNRRALSLAAGTRLLRISYRQAKRLLARYRREGPQGLAHRRRGQPARNAFGPEMRDRVLKLSQEHYSQLNDTHFVEMLAEREGLRIGRETVRRWLRQAGIKPKRKHRPPKHRSRRPRRSQMGLLMQWDGSPHKWFGPDQPPCSLLHAADDGTNTVLGMLFRPHEDAIGYLRLLDMVLRRHGIPAAVYQDRHAALYRNDNHWSHEEELAGVRFATHVGRVLQDLTIEMIPAFSPQAKGRIERQGGTFQDRLIAEMALAGITEIDAANEWLEHTFLPRFNHRFAKSPEQPGSAFRKISDAERYLKVCFAYEASVANDNTVRLKGLIIDIPPGPQRRTYARCRVLVRQHLDGAWTVWLEDKCIARYASTPLREPLRTWRPRQRGEDHQSRHIIQVYLETTPAPAPGGHFCLADKGTF
jgi:transposase